MQTTLYSITTGNKKEYTISHKTFQSSYKKDIFHTSIEVDTLGLKEDSQADHKHHGGKDKAIHIGSTKHFEIFEKLNNKKLDPLAIGCNIYINDYDENDICVGDIYSIGDVQIEVSQPRQPCWKIGAIFGKEISRYISKNHAIGWYVRILKEGILNSSDTMVLEQRVSQLTIKQLSIYLNNPPKDDKKLIDTILSTKSLAQSYKDDLELSLRKH